MDLTKVIDTESLSYWDKIIDKIVSYLPKMLSAIIIFAIGIVISKIILKIMEKALGRSRLDKTIHSFLKSIVKCALYTLVTVISLSSLGVEMSTIVAVVGAAGLAVGLALQSSLSNVAGGFIILLSKPFKKGDYIEANGISGLVEEISILSTKLLTVDNKVIHIPNGSLSGSIITNYTEEKLRRLDIDFSISYEDDFEKAIDVITKIIENHPLSLKDPKPFVRMKEHSQSAIIITSRIWVESENYWDLKFDMLEQTKLEFDKNKITIPYNQIEVHINK